MTFVILYNHDNIALVTIMQVLKLINYLLFVDSLNWYEFFINHLVLIFLN